MQQNRSRTALTVAMLGSMTQAQRAQQVLARAAIRTEIVKADEDSAHGCAYGVAFPAAHRGNVRAILDAARINVRRFVEQ